MYWPPFTSTLSPQRKSQLMTNWIALAMSAGLPLRLSGVAFFQFSKCVYAK